MSRAQTIVEKLRKATYQWYKVHKPLEQLFEEILSENIQSPEIRKRVAELLVKSLDEEKSEERILEYLMQIGKALGENHREVKEAISIFLDHHFSLVKDGYYIELENEVSDE